jgi:hypothetical protein
MRLPAPIACCFLLLLPLAAYSQVLAPATATAVPRSNVLQVVRAESLQSRASKATAAQRAAMRKRVREENFDLGARFQLRPAEEAQVIELLVEVGLAEAAATPPSAWRMSLQAVRDEQRQRIEEVLGQQRSFYEYENALPVRRRVIAFSAKLDAANPLSLEQKVRMAELLGREEWKTMMVRANVFAFVPEDPEAARELVRKYDLQRKEYDYRRDREVTRLQVEQLRAILTQRQLLVYERLEADRLAIERSYVESLRIAAGLSRTIPD